MDNPTTLTAASVTPRVTTPRPLLTLGWIGLVGGVLGAASAVVVLATPPMVTTDRYSYPFDTTSYVVAQSFFAVQHLTLIALVVGLVLLERRIRSRLALVGLALSGLGLLGLTTCELFALTASSAASGSAAATRVDNSYGLPMIGIGLGLVLAGIGVARSHVLTGTARWLPLALGVFVFVVLFPAVFGPQVAGRLAIGSWMLLFAALGLAVVRAATDLVPPTAPRESNR